MKLPNTIIIGAQKAGTTSLYDWLGQHPEVYAHPGMKDYDFFINDEIFEQGLDWFSQAFSRANKESVILHGHVNYIFFPIAAKRIYEYNPDIKMFLVIRNPIDRAYSAYWDARKVAKENCSTFEEAVSIEGDRKKGTLDEQGMLTYCSHGLYAKQLKEYLNFFRKDQIKIILFEELVQNKESVIKECFGFLDIDDSFIPDFKIKNESGMPRSFYLQKFFQKLKTPKLIKKFIPPHLPSNIKTYLIRTLNVKKQKYPPMSLETKEKLRKFFLSDIEELESMLNLDLSHWKKLDDR